MFMCMFLSHANHPPPSIPVIEPGKFIVLHNLHNGARAFYQNYSNAAVVRKYEHASSEFFGGNPI